MSENIFAKRLRETRQNLNKSMADIASETGLTASAISSYEKEDGKTPSLINAQKIALALGVSLDWLSGMDDITQGRDLPKEIVAENVLKAIDVLKKHTPFYRIEQGKVADRYYNLVIGIDNFQLENYLCEMETIDKAIELSGMSPQLQNMVKNEIKKKYIDLLAADIKDGIIRDDKGSAF